jgi:hypothetical protein
MLQHGRAQGHRPYIPFYFYSRSEASGNNFQQLPQEQKYDQSVLAWAYLYSDLRATG